MLVQWGLILTSKLQRLWFPRVNAKRSPKFEEFVALKVRRLSHREFTSILYVISVMERVQNQYLNSSLSLNGRNLGLLICNDEPTQDIQRQS